MSLLKCAEDVAEANKRALKDRVAEEQTLLEAQRPEMEKVVGAREALEQKGRRLGAALAEFEARTNATDQPEKPLKDHAAAPVRERSEIKSMWKNVEAENQRVARKEETIEALVPRSAACQRSGSASTRRSARCTRRPPT